MRKPDFCICENKDADQLRGNREADQRLCFRYTDNTVRPNPVAGEAGHVRLERPIDSSSDKTVCAPKVAEKGPYKGGTLGFINKPLTDPDFCS